MPEIKNQFTGGKMNKDLDERLVPKGEYRDAMNIQVSTSEESDVGTVQNILGNIAGCTYGEQGSGIGVNPILPGSTTVGSISDEKNDSLYWLVAGPRYSDFDGGLDASETISFKDIIMRTSTGYISGCHPVFVDKWKFCTGVTAASTTTIKDTIVLDDSDLYSNIVPGMLASGYNDADPPVKLFSDVLVKSVKSINTIPLNFYPGWDTATTNVTSTSAPVEMLIRTFEMGGYSTITGQGDEAHLHSLWNRGNYLGNGGFHPQPVSPTTSSGHIQLLLRTSQFGINNILPPQFVQGNSINYIKNSSDDNIFGSGTIERVFVANLDPTYAYLPPTPPGNNHFDYYVVEIQPDDWGSYNSQYHEWVLPGNMGGHYPSQVRAHAPVYVVAESVSATTQINPNNTINIDSSSNTWLDEVYQVLFDESGSPTGAKLKVNNSFATGANYPIDSCIDPNSVKNVADGFNPPTSYDNSFELVDCTSLTTPANAIVAPPIIRGNIQQINIQQINFDIIQGDAIEAIYLNDSVDLNNVSTFCFEADRVLNFDKDRPITGINIVDDMLFWTDNFSEPKKINITRSIRGTDYFGDTHTAVVNDSAQPPLNISNYHPVHEEHVTVIRKNPKNALNLELLTGRDPFLKYTGVTQVIIPGSGQNNLIVSSSNASVTHDFSNLIIGDVVKFAIDRDIDGLSSGDNDFELAWEEGDYLLLKEFIEGVPSAIPLSSWTIRGRIRTWNEDTNGDWNVEIKVVGLNGTPPSADPNTPTIPLEYVVDIEDRDNKIFEDKLPRFSYRYKYEDGEYSTFAPWSEVAFAPGSFDYDPKKGWNLGMVNKLTSIKLKGFIPTIWDNPIGQDVIEVDILYKEDASPNVYLVETIGPNDIGVASNFWLKNEYEIDSETIKTILPSNQLLRSWDNVPKKALAQDVTGNRIVYANYEQNYDLKIGDQKWRPNIVNALTIWENKVEGVAKKSIKSLRDYKLGVVFTDKYGRETPLLTSKSGGFKVEKIDSDKSNRLSVRLTNNTIPPDMAYFKFYIKETSSEYYNLAMDRWYNAEDGNIWLAFPSSDRNKVDLETSLYFKKGNDESALENTTRYKILAIENQAPEFIKTRRIRIGTVTHNATSRRVFGLDTNELLNAPMYNNPSFEVKYDSFSGSSLSNLDDITEDIYIRFANSADQSSQYKVSEITADRVVPGPSGGVQEPLAYFITLDTPLQADDIGFIYDNPNNPSEIKENIKLQFYKAVVENKPIFDGRFFAKIENDGKIKTQITDDSIGVNYLEKFSKKVYVLDGDDDLLYLSSEAAVGARTNHWEDSSIFWRYQTGGDTANLVTNTYGNSLGVEDRDLTENNPYGRNYNFYYARQSYFGHIRRDNMAEEDSKWNSTKNQTFDYIMPLQLSKTQDKTGVWFINRSVKKYQRPGDDPELYWPEVASMSDFTPQCYLLSDTCGWGYHLPPSWGSSSSWSVFGGIYNGTRYSNINLAFGGFGYGVTNTDGENWFSRQRPSLSHNHPHVIDNFFSIGKEGGNPKASKPNDIGFVDGLQAGMSFKWKQDPTETVYTVVDQTSPTNNVRWGKGDATSSDDHEDGGAYEQGPLLLQAESTYHRNWNFNVIPSMRDWDPAGNVGTEIDKGLHLGSGLNADDEGMSDLHTLTISNGGTSTTMEFLGEDISAIRVGMSIITIDGNSANSAHFTDTSAFPANNKFQKVEAIDVSATPPTITLSHAPNNGIPADAELTFGYAIRLIQENVYNKTTANGTFTSTVPTENYIIVDSITTECSNVYPRLNPVYSLHKGMALDSWNLDSVTTGGTVRNNVVIKDIDSTQTIDGKTVHKITFGGYKYPLGRNVTFGTSSFSSGSINEFDQEPVVGERMLFKQVTMNGASNFTEMNNDDSMDLFGGNGGIVGVGYDMVIVEPFDEYSGGGNLPPNPFVWETEPKDDTELDIYYEISGSNPVELNNSTISTAIPRGSIIRSISGEGAMPIIASNGLPTTFFSSPAGDEIKFVTKLWRGPGDAPAFTYHPDFPPLSKPISGSKPIGNGSVIEITRPNGIVFYAIVEEAIPHHTNSSYTNQLKLKKSLHSANYILNWHNCYSFGNGVESNRIKDTFNSPFMTNGVKASMTLDQEYKREHRKNGLIYSGIYNSTSGINNLNQFIQAEKITKDINPIYGSIQKLHSGWGQSGDLLTLCEDRVLKILANKDALFNADGNTNITATNRVLGTATPYSGDFGISKNPESFASEAYRAYFTDKVRGTVMRLSIDGLTPISDHGMKDWFRDNIKLTNSLIGSYDDKKDEYNITLKGDAIAKTVTFKENVKGWVSFKSFIPENAISCASEYYTFLNGRLWKHHDETVNRNTFYGVHNTNHYSTFTAILNEAPGVVKSFSTLNYEGSKSKVNQNAIDDQYYNLQPRPGWYVDNIKTDLESGSISEFIEKEGKWFNYIKGENVTHDNSSNIKINTDGSSLFDQSSLAIQGLGILGGAPVPPDPVSGCTDETANNYNALANVDDGSCTYNPILGCTKVTASNYNPLATQDDDSCIWYGCTNSSALNYVAFPPEATSYSGIGIVDDGSCTLPVYGCTDPLASNYNNGANTDDGSCTYPVYGCSESTAQNFDNTVTDDNGSCSWSFCSEPLDNSYGTVNGSAYCTGTSTAIETCMNNLITILQTYNSTLYNPFPPSSWDNSPCTSGGCTDPTSSAYNSSSPATWDDGSCTGCTDPLAWNYRSTSSVDDGSCGAQCDWTSCDNAVTPIYNVTNIVGFDGDNGIMGSFSINTATNACYTTRLEDNITYPLDFNLITPGASVKTVNQGTGQVTFSNLGGGTHLVMASSTLPHQSGLPCSLQIMVDVPTLTYINGCTDPAANNYVTASSSNVTVVEDGSCTYTVECYSCVGNAPNIVVNGGQSSTIQTVAGACTNPPVTNHSGFGPQNFTLTHALATYGDSGSQSNPYPGGQGCNLGCMDSTAINYNPGHNNNHNQTCEYCDMTKDTQGNAIGSSDVFGLTVVDSTTVGGNGRITVDPDDHAPYTSAFSGYDIELWQVAGPQSSTTGGTLVNSVLNQPGGVSFYPLQAGYYYVKITSQTIGASGNTCSLTSSLQQVDQVITGCMSGHASNYNSSADVGMYGANVAPWLNTNNNCNNGNPAPGHCCFNTTVKRCVTAGMTGTGGTTPGYIQSKTFPNNSDRGMPSGSVALGYVTFAQGQANYASGQWDTTTNGCNPGCKNPIGCNYNANFSHDPGSINGVATCQGVNVGPARWGCINGSCQGISPCDPAYATGYASEAACVSDGCQLQSVYQQANLQPSDLRSKENIVHISNSMSGIPIYEFNYIGEKQTWSGVMAQDLLEIGRQDAVTINEEGYYMVNYSLIDVDMKKVTKNS